MDWGAVEQTLRGWIKSATGLDDEHVLRYGQDMSGVTLPFCDVRITFIQPVGAADAVDHDYNSGAPAGEEITYTARGIREFGVRVRAFSTLAVGTNSAQALLSKVQTFMALPGGRAAFQAGGFTAFDQGRILSVPAILDANWEGQAFLETRFYAEETATEKTTYIQTAELTNQEPNPDHVFTVTIP